MDKDTVTLWVGIRQALLMVVDKIEEYIGIDKEMRTAALRKEGKKAVKDRRP